MGNHTTPQREDVDWQGGCLCGAARYRVAREPLDADYCHCRMCQRVSGSGVMAWMDFLAHDIVWESNATMKEFASSEHIRRGFCDQCGSTMSYRHVKHPTLFSLAITSLDDPNQVTPTHHIHTESQVSWMSIDDDCPRYLRGQA